MPWELLLEINRKNKIIIIKTHKHRTTKTPQCRCPLLLHQHIAPCCIFRKWQVSSRCLVCPGSAKATCITSTPCTLCLSSQILTASSNLFSDTLSLSHLIRSLCKMFAANSECHHKRAEQGQAKWDGRASCLTDSCSASLLPSICRGNTQRSLLQELSTSLSPHSNDDN